MTSYNKIQVWEVQPQKRSLYQQKYIFIWEERWFQISLGKFWRFRVVLSILKNGDFLREDIVFNLVTLNLFA